ncbi:MAG: hypothetical protein IJB79_02275, partial [Candidatus Gastranaerophilales bacterium]|nr:hypothetical protein [Candidatus Gastranaerophilales bacterium]
LLFLGTGEKYQVSPSSSGTITVDGCEMSKSLLGIITVDINGEEEPNTPYKDQFNFPISSKGIEYEMMCQEGSAGEEKEDITCEEAYAIEQQYCEKINYYIGPDFCTSLPGQWVYEQGVMNSSCGTCYFNTEEEREVCHDEIGCSGGGSIGYPRCHNTKCNVRVGTYSVCPVPE